MEKKQLKNLLKRLSKNTFQIKESFDEFKTDIDNKIINLKTEPIDTRKEKDFINIFKMTLDIAKKIDKINNSNDNVKLLFDDTIFFTDQKWYQNLDYTTKYPHLIYILNRYDGIYEDIIEIIKIKKTNFKTDENTIPFWLIILRLLSNIHNIEVDYNQENNELSKTISDKESIYLQNKIIKIAYENNIQVDTQWINLCLKNLINNSLFSNKSRHIYNYIFSQIQSLPKLNEEISQIIEDNIMKFNNKIIDYQFENKIKDIYDFDLSEDDDIIKIINNPKDFYKYEIQKKYNKIMKDLINSQHFKKLNDSYGHLFGDEVLQVISEYFKDSLRKTDSVARYGGEELVAILPETSIDHAAIPLERFRQKVENHEFISTGKTVHVTISIGIAQNDFTL